MSAAYRNTQECPHEELAIAWVLRALEPAEEAEFLAHLPTCAICRDVVTQTQSVTQQLGQALPSEEPPAHLRASLLATVAAEPRAEKSSRDVPAVPSENSPTVATVIPSNELAQRRQRKGLLLVVAAAVVALALVVGQGLWNYQLRQERDDQARRVGELAQAVQIVADPNARKVSLGATSDGHPVAMLMVTGGKGAIIPMDLAANDHANQTYVLWGTTSAGGPKPLGVFDVANPGAEPKTLVWADGNTLFNGYAISLEQGRTAPTAPTKIVGLGKLEQS